MPTQPNPCDLLRLLAEQMEAEAKTRLRGAKALLAWLERCADTTATPAQVDGSPLRLKTVPSSPESKALASLFKRPLTKPWSDKEVAAKVKAAPTLEDIEMVAAYYEAERAKPDGIHRRDLQTCLNNWQGEVDRARAFSEKRHKPQPAAYVDPVAAALEGA